MIMPIRSPFLIGLLIGGTVGALAIAIRAATPWADHRRRSSPAEMRTHAHP